jgi:hypothetical protein
MKSSVSGAEWENEEGERDEKRNELNKESDEM